MDRLIVPRSVRTIATRFSLPLPFQLSQRADYIVNDFFEWVQQNRAIVNTGMNHWPTRINTVAFTSCWAIQTWPRWRRP